MKIKQLHIEGFRSLKNVTWEPGDLNILIGANGTGKSNLLRFLEMMVVSARGGLGKYVRSLGGIDAVTWDGQAEHISFALDFDDEFLRPHCYELRLTRMGRSGVYNITREVLSMAYNDEKEEPLVFIERGWHDARVKEYMPSEFRELDPMKISLEETLLSSATGALLTLPNIAGFHDSLVSFATFHDIQVHSDAEIRRPSVSRVEKQVEPDGQNLINVLHTLYTSDREFERNVDAAMRAAFGGDYEKLVFPPAADQRIQLRVRWKTLKREQSAADLSDGTLRFLFLLTVLASPDPPPVIAIDEPETGLHPAMLPIVAEFAADAALRAQVVLSTHSPQLLDAFTETKPTTTVFKWHDGETLLQNLSGEDLDYWLKEYTLGALFKSGELERMA
ncbi:MAG: AAA family ATPase [Pyrinomonadaceae bacterium]